jgi:hypothetical protein
VSGIAEEVHVGEPIVYVDQSAVEPDKFDELKAAISELVAFVEEREPQLISYGFYLEREPPRMTVVAVHHDSASLELHLSVGGPLFRKVGEFIDLERIDVYGEPSDAAVDQLLTKAGMLRTDAPVVAHELHAGFARIPSEAVLNPT